MAGRKHSHVYEYRASYSAVPELLLMNYYVRLHKKALTIPGHRERFVAHSWARSCTTGGGDH